jgi:hypothetical protein
LDSKEAKYIQSYYQPKESQFCQAYTQTYLNLGVYSTQQNESYYNVVKAKLYKNISISKAVQIIVEKTKDLGQRYNAEINQQRRTTSQIFDRVAFVTVKWKLAQYMLELSVKECSATKRMTDNIEEGKEKEFYFDIDKGCTFGCELPA